MISIIICSRKADISDELKTNIATTIGCEYELCVIDNSSNEYNIFTAYNEGVLRAKGDVLCFMHEDIVFHSSEWGSVVSEIYKREKKLGVIGVIGGQFLPKTPTSYWEGGCGLGQIIQGITKQGQYRTFLNGRKIETLDATYALVDVVAVDGLWMCAPRWLFEEGIIRWDCDTFDNFHCYDMDICIQTIQAGYRVAVVGGVVIEHQSYGNTDTNYCKQSQKLFDKWKDELPLVRGREMSEQEIEERTRMVTQMRSYLVMYNATQDRCNNMLRSKAYRIGKFLLKPFIWLKRCKVYSVRK
ncbi:MAG: hypothetical protein IJR32_00935 [Paludibacteraceae bacterium]|nr:hypothetical protein [Paludibacteraceae bacterium]